MSILISYLIAAYAVILLYLFSSRNTFCRSEYITGVTFLAAPVIFPILLVALIVHTTGTILEILFDLLDKHK